MAEKSMLKQEKSFGLDKISGWRCDYSLSNFQILDRAVNRHFSPAI